MKCRKSDLYKDTKVALQMKTKTVTATSFPFMPTETKQAFENVTEINGGFVS
ncbi:hypothetical protein KIN20_009459 [Parelaphostrongylus tenuis]|uniref:Uncharacterized protein n=1 Tax=Parelaphostrongylus tenuis TaxID=148309 RepID=A0AAD5QL98_PARTN|nr:hypothetical protein KIN20_009459 [Parelaphostrongylus tenuis]